jgi:hypothetical protein
MTPPPDINADLNNEGITDFGNFSVLVNMWLHTQVQP